jgi:ArsR family transcriptional regulator
MRKTSEIFKALSDSNRLRIMKMLEIRPLCVCEIQAVLNLAASTVSKHLSILRHAGFIIDQKEQKWVNYYLNPMVDDHMVKKLLHMIQYDLPYNDVIRMDAEKVKTVDRNKLCKI